MVKFLVRSTVYEQKTQWTIKLTIPKKEIQTRDEAQVISHLLHREAVKYLDLQDEF